MPEARAPYLQGDGGRLVGEEEDGMWLERFQREMDVPVPPLCRSVLHVALPVEPCGSTCKSHQRDQCHRLTCFIQFLGGGVSSRAAQLKDLHTSPCPGTTAQLGVRTHEPTSEES